MKLEDVITEDEREELEEATIEQERERSKYGDRL